MLNLNQLSKHLYVSVIPDPGSNEVFQYKYIHTFTDEHDLEITRKEYIPGPKDRLYFFQGCNVPRFKVRDWGKKNDASVTIKIENATAMIASANSLEKYVEKEYRSSMNKGLFMRWIRKNYNLNDSSVYDFYNKIKEISTDMIYVNRSLTYDQGGNFKVSMEQISPTIRNGEWIYEVEDVNIKHVQLLLSSPLICSEESLIPFVNSSAAIITQDYYNELRTLLSSINEKDQGLALEIMGSCQHKPSLHYILLLMQEFGSNVCHMKETKHVNFKSLITFINLDYSDWEQISNDDIIETLMKHKVLTMDVLKEYAIEFKKRFTEGLKEGRYMQSKYFKISEIEATDEIKQYFSNH